jgi:hypothetical protein
MKRSLRAGKPAPLSDLVHRNLNMYALAATAAGVGALAMTQPAEAKIVYTPANVSITPGTTVPIDLNNDGTVDFNLTNWNSKAQSSGIVSSSLSAQPAQPGNAIWGYVNRKSHVVSAAALPAGFQIAANKRFHIFTNSMAGRYANAFEHEDTCRGKWQQASKKYLGLRFMINGRVHYGWARLDVSCNGNVSGTLTGYAYESIPNKPIITGKTKGSDIEDHTFTASAPEPATLWSLALGSPALSVWRRNQSIGIR